MIELNASYGGPSIHKTERLNPTEVLISLIDENPSASRDVLKREFYERVHNDEDYLRPIIEYFFINAMNGIDGAKRRKRVPNSERAARIEAIKIEATKLAEKIKSVVILDLVLPHGKTVRESTFGECGKLGGLFFRKLSKLGRPKQVVGKHVTDQQADDLYKQIQK